MYMADDPANSPELADWIRQRCKNHYEPFVRESVGMIEYCLDLDVRIPERYGWRYAEPETIKKQVESATSPSEINAIFWLDQLRNVEAYSTMSFWRGIELVKSSIRGLNLNEIVSPAVLTRSAIELACC